MYLAVRLYKKGTFDKAQRIACIILFIWSAIVLFMTVLGRRTHDYYTDNYNFEWFHSYRQIIIDNDGKMLISVLQNIIMFIPIGLTLSMVFRRKHGFSVPLGISILFSLLIETCQLLLKSGLFELDDLFNNTLGALIGIITYLIFYGILNASIKKKEEGIEAENDS